MPHALARYIAVMALAGSSAGQAHDFWIQPSAWQPKPGATVEFTLEVGHGADRQRSPIRASRITVLRAVDSTGAAVDLRPNLHVGDVKSDLTLQDTEGKPQVIALVTDASAESHLAADRFNFHLREEGLTEAIAWRAARQETANEGSENYGRVAKALLASTDPNHDSSVFMKPLGLELEIVPGADPYEAGDANLPIRVLWKGRALQGATVKLYDLANDVAPKAGCQTDQAGTCSFGLTRRGSWLLNVVWSTANPQGSPTDFRTIFSSLSFGFDGNGEGESENRE